MIQHSESSIKINYTKEYSLFKMIDGNRSLSESKIKRIITDIKNGIDLLRYCPILVVEKDARLHIVDGQHRFYVAKKLGSKVWYIIAEELSLYDIARMNSNTEKWSGKDFINCYSQIGINDYDVLSDFLKKFPIPVTTAVSLLQNGKSASGGGHDKESFEQGKFKVKYLGFATSLLQTIEKFSFHKKFTRPFIRAIELIVINNKIDINLLIKKTNEDAEQLKYAENEKQYLSALEIIFNKGKQNRVVIY